MYKTAGTLQGGGPAVLSGKLFTAILLIMGLITTLFCILTALDVFQLSKYEVVPIVIFGVLAALLFLAAIVYGLGGEFPMPVQRRTVAMAAILVGLVYFAIGIVTLLGAFSPASSDTKAALVGSTLGVAAVALVFGFYMAVPSN